MKKLYKQFNNLNIEMNVQPMEVSDIEKQRVKRSVMKGKKKNYLVRNFSVAAAFMLASTITLGFSFPTFAAKIPIIGNVFELFNDDEKKYVFEKYDTFSTDIGITKESKGISVTVTDAVYDGENKTIAYTIESEEDLGERPVLDGKLVVEEFQDAYKDSGYSSNYITKKISDNKYAGLFIYELISGPKPDEIHVTWEGDTIVNLNNVKKKFPGDWSFQFTLNELEAKTQELAKAGINTKDNGIEVALLKMTETPISSTFYLSEWVDERIVAMEEEEWRSVQIDYTISDNLGNKYNATHFRSLGHSPDFPPSHHSYLRLTTTLIHEEATSLTITPIVSVVEIIGPNGALGLVKEPYPIEAIQIPLNK